MTRPAPDVLWITWELQPRNRSMARELRASLCEFEIKGPRLLRYLRSSWRTVKHLLAHRPTVVCAPNPSLMLTCWLLALRAVFRYRLVSDAHYGGVLASNGSAALQRMLDFVNRRSDIVIVTNPRHVDHVRSVGGKPLICPDPLPSIPPGNPERNGGRGQKTALFICSFGVDEPYQAVLDAAPTLAAQGFRVLVTGNYRRVALDPAGVRPATLLGYVDTRSYHQYLRSADVLIDLTTFPDCLVCGAYEAMAVGTPCVLSDTPALREYFTAGVVFATHQPSAIAAAVMKAYDGRETLQAGIEAWRIGHQKYVANQIATLERSLGLQSTA